MGVPPLHRRELNIIIKGGRWLCFILRIIKYRMEVFSSLADILADYS